MQLIDSSAVAAVAWKNGGGTTRTVAVSPQGAGFDDFAWRVSIAEVLQSGSFSSFPGVDRTILLLDGAGMILRENNGSAYSLTRLFVPHSMPGEDPVEAHLVNGPAHDFNVMTRRGSAQAIVRVWQREDTIPRWTGDALLYCAQGDFQVCVDGKSALLPAGWACLLPGMHTALRVAPQAAGAVLIGALFEWTGH